MCNCGNKRNDPVRMQSFNQPKKIIPPKPAMWPDTYFEYTGKTGLTVTGNVTGKPYRFGQPGDKQLIDYRDAAAMMRVQVLKKATR